MKSAVDSESAAQAQRFNKGREQTSLKAFIEEELSYYKEEVEKPLITPRRTNG